MGHYFLALVAIRELVKDNLFIRAIEIKLKQWEELVQIMEGDNRSPDFITIDGGEGGTGAAPPSFADHVSLPWV